MSDAGIDYGMGISNIDHETGIRFGVISQNSISYEALEDFEAEYPEIKHDCADPETCDCRQDDEPIGFRYERDGYVLTMGTDGFGI